MNKEKYVTELKRMTDRETIMLDELVEKNLAKSSSDDEGNARNEVWGKVLKYVKKMISKSKDDELTHLEYYSTYEGTLDEADHIYIWESLVGNYLAKQNGRVIVSKDVEAKFNETVKANADELLHYFNEYGIEMIWHKKSYKILGRATLFRVAITEVVGEKIAG